MVSPPPNVMSFRYDNMVTKLRDANMHGVTTHSRECLYEACFRMLLLALNVCY